MARGHGKISTGFYQDPNVRALSEDARWLLQYLCTSPHSNAAGCYVLPIAYAADDLQWPIERVSRGFVELSRKPFVRRDPSTNIVCLPGWWDENPVESENVAKHIGKLFRALPNCPAKTIAINKMLGGTEHDAKGYARLLIEFPKGIEAPSEPIRTPEPEPEPDLLPSEGAVAPLKDRIFGPCLAWLATRSGVPAKKLRTVVGKWCSQAGDGATLEAMTEAERNCPVGDPVAYIEATLARKKTNAKSSPDENFSAQLAGLKNALGPREMATPGRSPADENPAIDGHCEPIEPIPTGDGAPVRDGDSPADRVRGGVSDPMPETGRGPRDLPGATRLVADRSSRAGDRPDQSPMDLENPDAIPSGYPEQDQGGMGSTSDAFIEGEGSAFESERTLSCQADRDPSADGQSPQTDQDDGLEIPPFLRRQSA